MGEANTGMDKDVRLALLGDHEAAKRLTEAGVLVPCPGCGGENIIDWYRHNEVWYQCDDCGWRGPSVYSRGFADTEQARLAWNTRAPILSVEERLPEDKQIVLFHQKNGFIYCAEYSAGNKLLSPAWFIDNDCWEANEVTHWMPLPAPPDRRPPEGEEDT